VRENYLKVLRRLAVAGLGMLAGGCLLSAHAFADACSDLTGQYNSTLQAYKASNFQFPQDCPRARDFFRAKREQAQSIVSVFHAASQACGSQFDKDRGPPPEQLASLLEHEAIALETGCDVLAGVQTTAPAPQQPPPAVGAPPVTPTSPPPAAVAPAAATPTSPPPAAVAPAAATPQPPVAAAPVTATPPPPSNQTAAPPPNQTAPPPNQSSAQSCAAQKTMPVAAGCNADFPQQVTGAACAAADNSVGLTLQVPGGEPTCCVTSCAKSKY
jgi:hypothetical protein